LGIVGTFIMKELPVSIKPGRSKGLLLQLIPKKANLLQEGLYAGYSS
jgi:hypothetical protein